MFAHVVETSTSCSIFACLASAPTYDHNDDDDDDDAASCAVLYALTDSNFPRLVQYPDCYLVECPLLAMGQMDVCLTLSALVVLVLEATQRSEEELL